MLELLEMGNLRIRERKKMKSHEELFMKLKGGSRIEKKTNKFKNHIRFDYQPAYDKISDSLYFFCVKAIQQIITWKTGKRLEN